MSRNIFGRPMHHRFAILVGLSPVLVVTALGCGDDTPRPGSLDVAASRKAAKAEGKVDPFGLGSKTGDVSPTKVKPGGNTVRLVYPEKGKKGPR
jgi:hypothetical protein